VGRPVQVRATTRPRPCRLSGYPAYVRTAQCPYSCWAWQASTSSWCLRSSIRNPARPCREQPRPRLPPFRTQPRGSPQGHGDGLRPLCPAAGVRPCSPTPVISRLGDRLAAAASGRALVPALGVQYHPGDCRPRRRGDQQLADGPAFLSRAACTPAAPRAENGRARPAGCRIPLWLPPATPVSLPQLSNPPTLRPLPWSCTSPAGVGHFGGASS